MRNKLQFATYALPALLAAALAPTARAGCGDPSQIQAPFTFVQPSSSPQAVAQHVEAAIRSATSSSALTNSANMVGFWKIQFISQDNGSHLPPIPDGALVDFGYTQWHSDGTEIMNSGGHAPATQNFCLGTWVRSGYFTYELNHYALSYNAASGALSAKVNIREQVTLDPSGNEFAGTFTIDVYDATTGGHLDHVAGTLAGQRITVDQTTP
jgi:hypothetical protein